MAADHNSGRPLFQPPSAASDHPSDASDHLSRRKVKFLCSFGGQIIPRPSDGALRYAGGQTRIVAVRRDAPLPEIIHKMSEVFGGPAALRYQLPDVDLDALVSVSSPEDLDNMMEEYDKLAEAAPDGSAKLRIFLCSPSDLANPSDPVAQLGVHDTGQRYVDAVNRISSDGSSICRKDSLASATSTQNSDGTDAFVDAINEGMSPALLSPAAAAAAAAAASHDPSRLYFAATPVGFPDAPTLPANPLPTSSNAPVQIGLINPSRMELPPSAPYSPHAYADPNQAQFVNRQPLVSTASLPINAAATPPHPYVPPTHHVPSTPIASQIGSTKSTPESYLEDNFYVGRPALLHSDPNYTTAYQPQPQPQLPPLSSTYLRPENVERYSLHPAVPQPMQGQALKLEDCYMCQKALPHAHSDTLVQEHGSGSGNAAPEASAVFHSMRSEDTIRRGAPHRVITGPLTESSVEPKAENMVALDQFAATYGFDQIPEIRHNSDKLVALNTEGSDLCKVMHPPGAMGLPNNTQASNGMFVNIPQSHREDSLLLQQQHLPRSFGQPQPLVKQDWICNLYGNDVYPVKNVNAQAAEPLSRVPVPESPYGYGRIVDGRTEALHVSPFESSVYNENRNPTVIPNFVIPPNDLKPENLPLTENNHPVRPQGGNTRFVGNAFTNPGNSLEGTYVTPVDQLLSSSSGFTQLHNLHPTVSNQITTAGAFLPNQETGTESMVPNERLHGTLAYSRIMDPSHNNNVNKIPDGDWKDEASRYPKDAINDSAAPPSGKFPFPNSSSTTRHAEAFQELTPSDSLFCNQDPRKILVNTNLLPPRPTRVASKESMVSKDFPSENVPVSNIGPDVARLLEEGIFYQPSNSLSKDSCSEHPLPATRAEGSGEERINQELQAVAEGAAASVLQSSVPPVPIFVARETKGPTPQYNKERGFIEDSASSQNAVSLSDHRTEDMKPKQADKMNTGFPIGDEIGHLQIIKNNDLEELRELGSGTFGTVYHGKWRGSDVAIKRINDRCFAGKPSEQERTRLDFWNEASKLADLHHPNVVAFYGVVVDGPGGSVATVTEYMVNGSLRQVLQKNDKSLDCSKRLLIAMDAAFGMEYLHGKNIVHFDLKSDNLLVNLRDPQRPICKVGDLGLSKVKCNTLISGGVRGTLPWMAPELLNGSSSLVSEKVDVFSYGIVLWELLTGEEPYADLHYGAIIGGIVNNTLRPPVPESCDLEWRSLMEKCWSSEPSERPSFTVIASRLRSMSASINSKGR